MGISIYYTACRTQPLSLTEQMTVDAIVARYPVEALIAGSGVVEGEFNGEAFRVYPVDGNTKQRLAFEGATKLPLCSEGAMWAAVQYWCRLLSEVRRVLPDATWRVHIDDRDIAWDEDLRVFDPSA
jgi:hypothetical protein